MDRIGRNIEASDETDRYQTRDESQKCIRSNSLNMRLPDAVAPIPIPLLLLLVCLVPSAALAIRYARKKAPPPPRRLLYGAKLLGRGSPADAALGMYEEVTRMPPRGAKVRAVVVFIPGNPGQPVLRAPPPPPPGGA